jgi:hypothetical protein
MVNDHERSLAQTLEGVNARSLAAVNDQILGAWWRGPCCDVRPV